MPTTALESGVAPVYVGTAPDDRTVSIAQACAIVRVTRRTIYNWLKAGKLRTKRTAGGSLRIYESSLWQSETN